MSPKINYTYLKSRVRGKRDAVIVDGAVTTPAAMSWSVLYAIGPKTTLHSALENNSSRVDVATTILANVNSRSRSLYAVARPSVVCLYRRLKFSAIFQRHTSTENFTEIVPGENLRRGS